MAAPLTPTEHTAFEQWFQVADADRDGYIGLADAAFFLKSELPKDQLARVWALADVSGTGFLARPEFAIACRAIGLLQSGQDLSAFHQLPNFPLPAFKGVPLPNPVSTISVPDPKPSPAPVTPPAAAGPGPSAAESAQWVITPTERTKYDLTFIRADEDNDGFISGEQLQARDLFTRSKLPLVDLRHIWALSDQDGDQRLSRNEFAVAMHLINARLKGGELPPTLPATLVARTMEPLAYYGSEMESNSRQRRSSPDSANSPSASPYSTPSSAPPPATTAPPAATPAPSLPSAPSAAPAVQSISWTLSPEDRAAFLQTFQAADEDRDGFLTGEQARDILSRSKLPSAVLRRVWSLCKLDQEYRLGPEEFAIATFLINVKLKGGELPDALPESLRLSAFGMPPTQAQAPPPQPQPVAASPTPSTVPAVSSPLTGKLQPPPQSSNTIRRKPLLSSYTSSPALTSPASPGAAPATPPPAAAPTSIAAIAATLQSQSSSPAPASPSPVAEYFPPPGTDDFSQPVVSPADQQKAVTVEGLRSKISIIEKNNQMSTKRLEDIATRNSDLDKHQTIAELQQAVQEQEQARLDIMKEYQEEYDKMQAQAKKCEALRKQAEQLEAGNKQTVKKLKEQERAAAEADANVKKEEQRLEVLTKEVRELQLKSELEQGKATGAQGKLDLLRGKLRALEEQKAALGRQMQDKSQATQQEGGEIKALEAQVGAASAQLDQMQAQAQKQNAELEALRTRKTDLRNQLTQLQQQQAQKTEELRKLQEEIRLAREEVDRLKPQAKEASKRLQSTKETNVALKSEVDALKDQKTEMKREIGSVLSGRQTISVVSPAPRKEPVPEPPKEKETPKPEAPPAAYVKPVVVDMPAPTVKPSEIAAKENASSARTSARAPTPNTPVVPPAKPEPSKTPLKGSIEVPETKTPEKKSSPGKQRQEKKPEDTKPVKSSPSGERKDEKVVLKSSFSTPEIRSHSSSRERERPHKDAEKEKEGKASAPEEAPPSPVLSSKDRSSGDGRRSLRHSSTRKSRKTVKDEASATPVNPFASPAGDDPFANPFSFNSSDDPFAPVPEEDPFDFDFPDGDPFDFKSTKNVRYDVLDTRDSFVLTVANPFGADLFGSSDFGK